MEDNSEQPIQTEKAREFDFREIKTNKNSFNKFIPLGVFLVLIIVMVAGFFIFVKAKSTKKETSSETGTKQSTTSAKQTSDNCPDKTAFINQKQGYETCYPQGWIEKELKVSGLNVGFDPKQVDDKFPGSINISISDTSEAQTVQDISDNTSKFTYEPAKIDSIKGTKIDFTRLKSDSLSDISPYGTIYVVTNFGRTYTLTFNSAEAGPNAIYDTFIQDFKFIKDTQDPPWSDSRNILVFSPWFGDSIASPVTISGEAVAFEGTVNLRIKDSAGHVLKETTTQATTGQERSAFSASVDFSKPTSKKGTVEVYLTSAKDGSEQDKVSIPVVFP